MKHRILSFFLLIILLVTIVHNDSFAAEGDYEALAESRKEMTIESDLIENWPAGPKIGAQSAILIEANSGAVLYEKNVHEHLYPASVTKILTALIAVEKCDMNEMVTFSYDAVNSIDWRTDANMGINAGDSITMEQCLYGLLVGSANEVAYAIAEHICGPGNLDDFSKLMNEKAISLGCTDSNFITPNGIHDENHYTSAYDLSLIAKAFFSNELLCRMASTVKYTVPQTETQPNPDMTVYAKSKLHPGKEYAFEGLIGTKTGYTEYARQTLVSCAEVNGMRLICVILKEEAPAQYTDTIDLFNYGFNNFVIYNVANNDTIYSINSANSFSSDVEIFGSSTPLIQINSRDYILLPVGAEYESASSVVSYDTDDPEAIAQIMYYYNDAFVGSAHIIPSSHEISGYSFGLNLSGIKENTDSDNHIVVVNVLKLIIYILIITFIIFFACIIYYVMIFKKRNKRHIINSKSYDLASKNNTLITKKRR